MLEVLDSDVVYNERFKALLPEYMRDPIDYYITHNIRPQVYKYNVAICPIHNGIPVDISPILFEEGDNLDVKIGI